MSLAPPDKGVRVKRLRLGTLIGASSLAEAFIEAPLGIACEKGWLAALFNLDIPNAQTHQIG